MAFVSCLMEELEQERAVLQASSHQDIDNPYAAIREFALNLYSRARGSDKPEVSHPHPSMKWTIVDAPKVAQAFHACAVIIDSLRQFTPLAKDLAQVQQHAHARSQQLSSQLARALNCPPCVPVEWRPIPEALLSPPKPVSASASEQRPAASTRPSAASLPSVPKGNCTRGNSPSANALPGGVPASTVPVDSHPPTSSVPNPQDKPTPPLAKGDDVWYFEQNTGWHQSKILAVHHYDAVPFYTILYPLSSGNERETELSRLRPRQPGQPPPTIKPSDVLSAGGASQQSCDEHLLPPPGSNAHVAPSGITPAGVAPCGCNQNQRTQPEWPQPGLTRPGPTTSSSSHERKTPQGAPAPASFVPLPFVPPPAYVPRSAGDEVDGAGSLLSRLRKERSSSCAPVVVPAQQPGCAPRPAPKSAEVAPKPQLPPGLSHGDKAQVEGTSGQLRMPDRHVAQERPNEVHAFSPYQDALQHHTDAPPTETTQPAASSEGGSPPVGQRTSNSAADALMKSLLE